MGDVMNMSLTGIDVSLISYGSLIAATFGLVEAAKALFPRLVSGFEKRWVLLIAVVLGVISKLTIPHAFEGISWAPFIVSIILFAVPNTNKTHDDVYQPLTEKAERPIPTAEVVEEKKDASPTDISLPKDGESK